MRPPILRCHNKVLCPQLLTPSRRPFLSLPGTQPTTIYETRILPYNTASVYMLIADVDSYSSFLPYCQQSKVTKWSVADKNGKTWPAEANMKIGWGGYEETFTSTLFCRPNSIVEALGGDAESALSKSSEQIYSTRSSSRSSENAMFKRLRTRWTVKELPHALSLGHHQTDIAHNAASQQTEVHLSIEVQFSNPIYAAVSSTVAPKLATVMIEAFEKRALKLLGAPGASVH